jgi:hypothetical protein
MLISLLITFTRANQDFVDSSLVHVQLFGRRACDAFLSLGFVHDTAPKLKTRRTRLPVIAMVLPKKGWALSNRTEPTLNAMLLSINLQIEHLQSISLSSQSA